MLRRSATVINNAKPLFISLAKKSKQFSTVSSKTSSQVRLVQSAKASRTKFVRFYAKLPAGISEIAMPALSPTMTAGNITEWKVKVGDKISPGDVLCSVETDKATIDFENQQDGYVAKILLPNGTKEVTIGTPVLLLAESKDDVAKAANIEVSGKAEAPKQQAPAQQAAPAATTPAATQQPQATPAPVQQAAPATGGRVFASPLAKKVAEEANVPLSNVAGTGPNNRILKADVEEYAASQKQAKPTTVAATAPQTSAAAEYTDIPVTMTRKVIANRLLESKRNIPHYYLTVECQVDALLKIRNQLNKLGETRGFKLSVNDFIVKAAALSMKKVPEVNSSWMGDYIRQYKSADISVAVQTDTGLITPIVFAAEKRGLADISNTVKSLAQRARENKLALNEFQGGSFTISNLGMFGIQEFSAIINPPQSCILAVGTAEKKVVPNEGPDAKETPFKIVTTMKVTMSCDHRVVDGAVGAQWLQAFKEYIETPVMLML